MSVADDDMLPHLLALPHEQALPLLATADAGRLIHTREVSPCLFPVRHLVDGGLVILRARLLPSGSRSPVYPVRLAYQADRIDPDDHTGWAVIVTGDAEQITEPDQQARYRVPLHAWPDEHTEHLLRLRPEVVTGYRLTRMRA